MSAKPFGECLLISGEAGKGLIEVMAPRADAGRDFAMLFIDKGNGEVLPLRARDMADKERRSYGRK